MGVAAWSCDRKCSVTTKKPFYRGTVIIEVKWCAKQNEKTNDKSQTSGGSLTCLKFKGVKAM